MRTAGEVATDIEISVLAKAAHMIRGRASMTLSHPERMQAQVGSSDADIRLAGLFAELACIYRQPINFKAPEERGIEFEVYVCPAEGLEPKNMAYLISEFLMRKSIQTSTGRYSVAITRLGP